MNKKIKVIKDGPYVVSGKVPLQAESMVNDEEGNPCQWQAGQSFGEKDEYLLCRCGRSKTMPYCDQSHKTNGFNGTETASHQPFEDQAETINGPELTLKDAPSLCASAKFCDRAGSVWNLTEKSDNPKSKKLAIEETHNCPSGRLVVEDPKTGKTIEPNLDQSISVTQDAENVAGPFWVKGGIPLESADGKAYEIRNRVTLCRCGKSNNKPFCDGSHQ